MFHDYKPPPKPLFDPEPEGEWQSIERRIYSRWWRAAHNLLAHPLLTIHRPLGEKLHDYTAQKMYEPRPDVDPVVTDND